MFRKLRNPLLILGGGFFIMWVASKIIGVPLFHEFKDRARRVVERQIPVTPVGDRARIALDERLVSAKLELGSAVFVRIFKREAELEIWLKDGHQYSRLHTYPICKFSRFSWTKT